MKKNKIYDIILVKFKNSVGQGYKMKVLISAPDRDLLESVGKALKLHGHTAECAFDGVQLANKIGVFEPDVVLFDPSLPFFDMKKIISMLQSKEIPAIALTSSLTEKRQLDTDLHADSYLVYPFTLPELENRMISVCESCRSAVSADKFVVNGFTLDGDIRITYEEKYFLSRLAQGDAQSVNRCERYVNTLNKKFSDHKTGKAVRYIENEGYRIVRA